ncbi:MAG: ATP-binding protein [Fusobacteriaceae bacterium]|jgi:signal transduction histidine kinase|nr:ATP-binding protein [Fusobacteriaceae bacterium]
MKIKKDSLVKKIIDYNALAIVITSLFITVFLIILTFKSMNKEMLLRIIRKNVSVNIAYNDSMNATKNAIFKSLREEKLFAIKEDIRHISYEKLAKNIYNDLVQENSNLYSNSLISIIEEEGHVISEYGDNTIKEKFAISISKDNRNIVNDIASLPQDSISNDYKVKIDGEIFVIVVNSFYWTENDIKRYAIITFPLEKMLTLRLNDFLKLSDEDHVFIVTDNKILQNNENILDNSDGNLVFSKNTKLEENYISGKNDKKRGLYYFVSNDIVDYSGQTIGAVIIAVNRMSDIRQKIVITILLIAIVGLIIFVSSKIFRRVFYEILKPLSKIVKAADNVSRGIYDLDLNKYGVEEIKTLSSTFEKMVKVIKNKEEDLKDKNIKLQKNLHSLDTVEKIIMGINTEDDINITMKDILAAITSELGLGYSRAVYFRYSREMDALVGEFSKVNNALKKECEKFNEKLTGFQFQIFEIDKLVKLIKVPFKDDSLLKKSIVEKRVICHNEKGYKFDFGNDLFKSMGINNFLIFPIIDKSRNYGCVLVDNFGRNKIITKEDIELITLLFINISMKIINKNLEEEKIDKERVMTVGKLSEKFLNRRKIATEKIFSIVEKIDEYNIEDNQLKQVMVELKDELFKINKEIDILREYSDYKEEKTEFELFSLEMPIRNVMKNLSESFANDGITFSVFSNHEEKVFGNPKKIEKVFTELIKNAQDALNYKKNMDKKINIVITTDKRIDKIRISIKDNGIGMTQEQLKNVFDPFISYTNSPGLGLSIVSRIIKNHSGVIKINSKENEGTEVKITLNSYKEEII